MMVYGVLAIYTLGVATVGFVVGQQAFDPVEQAKFEARHWMQQSYSWREKVNAWKANYNRHANLVAGEPEPCPICDACEAPTFCYPKYGAICPELQCEAPLPAGFSGGEGNPLNSLAPQSDFLDWSTSTTTPVLNLPASTYTPPPGANGINTYVDLSVPMGDVNSPTPPASSSAGYSGLDSGLDSLASQANHKVGHMGYQDRAAAPAPTKGFTGGLSDLFARFHKRKPKLQAEEQCPPCEACGAATPAQQLMNSGDASHAPCNKQALLERLQQHEEKVLRRAKQNYVEDYEETKHCLQITMPAVYEAYEQSARTRGLSPEVFTQNDPMTKKHG